MSPMNPNRLLLLGVFASSIPSQNESFYSADEIVQISIEMDAGDWQKLRISHRDMVNDEITKSPYVYYKADVVIDGKEFKSVGVRKKGFFGSVVSTRPSLKIRFDKWEKGRLFEGMDQLTLNNNIQDSSQVHQYLAYMLFAKAGAPAPRCNFANVTLNGKSLGIYSNVESIRRPFLRRAFKNAKGTLYEGMAGDLEKNPVMFDRIVNKGKDAKAGRKPLEQLRDTLENPKATLAEIEKLVDVDAFVTTWAIEVLMGHWDSYSGNRNNYYLYRPKASKQFHFIPWGADSVFRDPGPFIQQRVPKSVKAVGKLCKRLWGFPTVQEKYRDEMRRLLKVAWDEKQLLAEIDRVERLLANHVSVPPMEFRGSLNLVRSFIRSRRQQVEPELRGEAPKWELAKFGLVEAGTEPTIELSGSFTTTMVARDPSNPASVGKSSLEVVIDGKKQKFAGAAAYAIPERKPFIRPGHPALQIVGQHPSTKVPWVLAFYIDPVRAALEKPDLTVDHFGVWAMLIRGSPTSPSAKRSIFGVVGKLRVDEYDPKIGGRISGSFKVSTNFGGRPPR